VIVWADPTRNRTTRPVPSARPPRSS